MKTTKEKMAEAIAKALGNGMSEKYEIHAQAALDVVCEELESDDMSNTVDNEICAVSDFDELSSVALKAAADRLRG